MTDTPTATSSPSADLVAALTALVDPGKDGKAIVQTRSQATYGYTYLVLSDVLAAVRAAFGAHNWAFTQPVTVADGHVTVANIWVHTSGERIEHPTFSLPCGRSPQEIGSAITYARRYSLMSLVGIAGRDDDDDAEAAQTAAQRRPDAERVPELTRPERAQARPDDPANTPWQQPAGTPIAEQPVDRQRTITAVPYKGHRAHEHGATDKSIEAMWALARRVHRDNAAAIRADLAAVVGKDDWHTNLLTQAQVSAAIRHLKATLGEPDEGE